MDGGLQPFFVEYKKNLDKRLDELFEKDARLNKLIEDGLKIIQDAERLGQTEYWKAIDASVEALLNERREGVNEMKEIDKEIGLLVSVGY